MRYVFPTSIVLILLFSSNNVSGYNIRYDYFSVDHNEYRNYNVFSDKILIVDAFATWCESCESQIYYNYEVDQYFGDNVTMLSLSVSPASDDVDAINQFIVDMENIHDISIDWEFGIDDEFDFRTEFKVESLPSTYLFDSDGILVKTWAGLTTSEEIIRVIDEDGTFNTESPLDLLIDQIKYNLAFQLTIVFLILVAILQISKKYLIHNNPTD
ncbi:MAG: TlpA family protein disulfide reductase [Candidatus Heimdallarchaeota archaeon]|nr:TlpA family protein disulfide reductase [Candidatus Heimdallarchaeota archaeon]MDH5647943.1 TlpA family protein disulfide reductase [Candidatus Heimdallarchaeota archaeon]